MADLSRIDTSDGREETRRAVQEQLGALQELLDRPDVIEVVINRPGEVWVETRDGWDTITNANMTFVRLERLAKATAAYAAQAFRDERPILSATLPSGARIQIVGPPATEAGVISVTIRKPSVRTWSLGELQSAGLFDGPKRQTNKDDTTSDLSTLLKSGDTKAFLAAAVKEKNNILISGATGSGKTTLSKALIAEIPDTERIITIEDTAELVVPQPNRVALFYPKDGPKDATGRARIGPKDLLESALRMRPDRILLQELRDGSAFYYLRNVNSGHPGSITTVHANSCALAVEQLTLLVKESDGGRDLTRTDIRELVNATVDVIIQCQRIGGAFKVVDVALTGTTPNDKAPN
ncbi:P-type DNA transfer ATPase VirB11 [Hyphomicrobium sp. 2TAF46]|uniref:P-type DNA transfer ATPase VirB11 n=1 Tax=Hyphomicrobium sp. 2TAF46 TaxID=3233019 RepID=UPI003F906C7D